MLAFVSDIHFIDGTAGDHNLNPRAFQLFVDDLKAQVARRSGQLPNGVKIVLLGDIFDLLRTEYWHDKPEGQRPWGIPTPKPDFIRGHASQVLKDVINHPKNRTSLEIMRKGVEEMSAVGQCQAEIVYIPGNHDRLVNLDSDLRDIVRQALGMAASSERFPNYFEDHEHGVFAQHGHEFDSFNFEGGDGRDAAAFAAVPIGDPITTELISRIAGAVRAKADQAGLGLSDAELDQLKKNFQDIENVRPFTATIEWLLHQVTVYRPLKDAIEDAIDETIQGFNRLKFVKNWYARHDRFLYPDLADALQLALAALEKFKVLPMEGIMSLVEKAKGKIMDADRFAKRAANLFNYLHSDIRYVLFGHTHDPLQRAVRCRNEPSGLVTRHVYLNTGTWRPRQHRCLEGMGFVEWKDMTYTVIYAPGERQDPVNTVPVFDTWNGSLLE